MRLEAKHNELICFGAHPDKLNHEIQPKNNATPVGFEPTQGDPIGLAGRRLSHSAKVSLVDLQNLRDQEGVFCSLASKTWSAEKSDSHAVFVADTHMLAYSRMHQWSSGRIHRCHRCDPGSIPG